MTARELLEKLTELEASPRLENGKLWLKAKNLTPEIRELVVARREELVRLLTSYPCSSCGRFAFPDPNTVCYYCSPPVLLKPRNDFDYQFRRPWERRGWPGKGSARNNTGKQQEDLL